MTLDLPGMYHVGLVVPDVDEAMDDFSGQFGLGWAPVQERELTIRHLGRLVTTGLRFTYSVQGPPHLELIGVAPGSPWEPAGSMHHVGFWADDLQATGRELEEAGLTLEATYDAPDGELFGFGYFIGPGGLRVEIVDGSRRPGMEEWLSGGAFPAARGN